MKLEPARANNFDALRLIGSLMVLFSHQFGFAGRTEPLIGGFSFGGLGVLMFFSMSGYLIYSSWLNDPDLGRFIRRRVLRIWPAYAAVVIICAVIAAVADAPAKPMSRVFECISQLFFVGRHASNGSLWTLKFELLCYATLVASVLVAGKFTRPAIAVIAPFALAWYLFEFGRQEAFDQPTAGFSYLAYFGAFFFMGVFIRTFDECLRPLVMTVAFAAGAFCVAKGETLLAVVLVLPLATIAIGTQSWPILRSASRYGDLSYGIYIWAWPVQMLGVAWLGKDAPLLLLLLATLCGTIPLAWLSWHLIEKRAIARKPVSRQVDTSPHSPPRLSAPSRKSRFHPTAHFRKT